MMRKRSLTLRVGYPETPDSESQATSKNKLFWTMLLVCFFLPGIVRADTELDQFFSQNLSLIHI